MLCTSITLLVEFKTEPCEELITLNDDDDDDEGESLVYEKKGFVRHKLVVFFNIILPVGDKLLKVYTDSNCLTEGS